MNCLLFGGGGFLGLNVARALAAQGHAVKIFDRPPAIQRLKGLGVRGFEWLEGDFANEAEVSDAIEGGEVVFHLVSSTLPKSSNENPAYDVESNVITTINMLEAARRKGARMVLFASSGGTVYGIPSHIPIPESHPTDPTCSYGIGKLAIEKYLRLYHELHGLDYRILRIANPYGEEQRPSGSQGAVAVFLSHALDGREIEIWGDGTVVRDFLYIGDVARAFILAMSYEGATRLFNIGAGEGHSLNELVAAIESVTGRPVARRYLPARGFDVPSNVLDISTAREVLGYAPTVGLHEGLERTVAWLRGAR